MGTTITIGIVHDNGIAGDAPLVRRLDQALDALLHIVTPDGTAYEAPRSVSLEREDTALLYTLTWGEHPEDTDAPDEPDELDDLSGVFQRIFDAIRSNRDAEEPSHLVDHVQRYVHDDGTVKVGERRIHSVTGNIATVTDITVERFVDADPLVVVYYTWVDRPEDGPLNGYQPYVAFQRTWAPSRKIRVATADSGLTVAIGKRYRNDREVVEIASIDEHPDGIVVTYRQAWDLTSFHQPFTAPEITVTLNYFAQRFPTHVDDIEAAPPAAGHDFEQWAVEMKNGAIDLVRVGQRRRNDPRGQRFPIQLTATVDRIHRFGGDTTVEYSFTKDGDWTHTNTCDVETFARSYPTIVEPEPEPEPAQQSLVIEVDGVELVLNQRWNPEVVNSGHYPVRIVGLVSLPNDDGEVDLASSAVFYRFADQPDHTRPYRTTVPAFLAAFPVLVQS